MTVHANTNLPPARTAPALMGHIAPQTASLSSFRSPTPQILFGKALSDVKTLARSIAQHGLLSPLLVSRHNGRLIVIDGRKRLAALRRLRFQKRLPRDLTHIPYVMSTHSQQKHLPHLLSARDLYAQVTALNAEGKTAENIAAALYLPHTMICDVLTIKRLSPALKRAFINGHLTLGQVKAFAALPHHGAQDRLLRILGPFANEDCIMAAIASGEAVIDLGGDNVVIMPSVQRQDTYKTAA